MKYLTFELYSSLHLKAKINFRLAFRLANMLTTKKHRFDAGLKDIA